MGQNERSAGVGWNGSKTGWGHVGMDIKSAGHVGLVVISVPVQTSILLAAVSSNCVRAGNGWPQTALWQH